MSDYRKISQNHTADFAVIGHFIEWWTGGSDLVWLKYEATTYTKCAVFCLLVTELL